VKAGDLKHPITLERPVTATDAKGNRQAVWKAYANVRASMKDVSGREFFEAQAHQALDIVTFGIRWRDDISAEHRIVIGGPKEGRPKAGLETASLGYERRAGGKGPCQPGAGQDGRKEAQTGAARMCEPCRQVYEIVHINHLGFRRDFMHVKARRIQGEGV